MEGDCLLPYVPESTKRINSNSTFVSARMFYASRAGIDIRLI